MTTKILTMNFKSGKSISLEVADYEWKIRANQLIELNITYGQKRPVTMYYRLSEIESILVESK